MDSICFLSPFSYVKVVKYMHELDLNTAVVKIKEVTKSQTQIRVIKMIQRSFQHVKCVAKCLSFLSSQSANGAEVLKVTWWQVLVSFIGVWLSQPLSLLKDVRHRSFSGPLLNPSPRHSSLMSPISSPRTYQCWMRYICVLFKKLNIHNLITIHMIISEIM